MRMFKRGRGQTKQIEVRSESTMAMDLKRQVKVKTGVVKRLRKELAMYEQEKVQNEKRVDEMRANGADTYDIRQAVSERGSRDPLLLFSGGHALVARSSSLARECF